MHALDFRLLRPGLLAGFGVGSSDIPGTSSFISPVVFPSAYCITLEVPFAFGLGQIQPGIMINLPAPTTTLKVLRFLSRGVLQLGWQENSQRSSPKCHATSTSVRYPSQRSIGESSQILGYFGHYPL